MTIQRLLFIINPGAGRGDIRKYLLSVIDVFVCCSIRVEVVTTRCEGDAARIVQELGSRFDTVVCCGGDGTVNEVVSGIVSLKKKPRLGIIPTGTTNDFSHTIGMPKEPVKAAQAICDGEAFLCDTGTLNAKPFIYVAAFGLFTDITYETAQEQKQLFGGAAYVFEAIRNFTSYSPYNITLQYEGGVISGEYMLCMVSNSVSMAGFRRMFDNMAHLDDGLFEVTLIKPPKTINELQKALNILLSIEPVDNNSDFLTVFSAKELSISSNRSIPWTVDGQNAGQHRTAELKVCAGSVEIIKMK